MKYLITLIAVLYSLNLHAVESDSLRVTLQKSDSAKYFVYLNFENISNDTILLVTKFKHELTDRPVGSGFRFTFYSDSSNSSFFPTLGEFYPKEYIYYGGRKYIYPGEMIRLPIDLTQYFFRITGRKTEDSIDIDIAYKYIVMSSDFRKRRVRGFYIKTDRIRVD